MNRFSCVGLGALLAFVASACGPQMMSTNDSGNPDAMTVPDSMNNPDTMMGGETGPDGGMNPEGGAEAGTDGGARTCNGVPFEDLNALGTRMGNTLTLMSDNNSAPATNTTLGIQVAGGRGTGVCQFRTIKERVFEYTVMTTSVLRVSTTNPMTARNFDSTIVIARPTTSGMCSLSGTNAPTVLGCNDDDPRYSGDDRRLTSVALTPTTVMAGTRVWIAIGGFAGVDGSRYMANESGAFQLTVEELAPLAAAAACDPRRLDNTCDDNSTCVDPNVSTGRGTCVANGSVAGARCMGTTCNSGLTCNNGVCTSATATAGMPCVRGLQDCATGNTCVNLERGSFQGTCRADGSVLGANCDSMGNCASGLTCFSGGTAQICLLSAAMSATCNTFDTQCASGQNCERATFNNGTSGTCTNTGTVAGGQCNAMGNCTGSGLTCGTVGSNMLCQRTVPTGMACGPFDTCANGGTCYFVDNSNRFQGRCFDPMTAGGACGATGTCGSGLMCSDMAAPTNGRCIVANVAMGGNCDFTHQCATDLTCVPNAATLGSMPFAGTCQPNGARGAPCGAMSACNSGLTCSGTGFTGGGICQAAATTSCDARFSTDRCPTGQVCRATGLTAGTCAAPTQETEPNNVPAAALTAVTVPAAIHGALPPASLAGATVGTDVDCFAVNVPANGRIFARVTSSAGLCPGNLQMNLYRIDGANGVRLLGNDADSGPYYCPRIDGADANFPWAANLAAGTYYVCIHNEAPTNAPAGTPPAAIYDYVVSLNAM